MRLSENPMYLDDIKNVAEYELPWSMLKDKSILISGATGLIGTFLIHTLLYRNKYHGMNCTILAISRNAEHAMDRLSLDGYAEGLTVLSQDINIPLDTAADSDYIIHAASNTHPIAYSTEPIGTITTNILGTYHLLNYAVNCHAKRFLFVSSVEIYGENRGDTRSFKEDYCGYINCNTLRAGYPESKRAGEALCQGYLKEKKLDFSIARLARTYGPTMLLSDTKAISQFIKNSIHNEDIVLKSEGRQLYSYSYVADAVSAILTIMLKGKTGEAYNISDAASDISLCDLAKIIASFNDRKVIFKLPSDAERAGYSTATIATLDSTRLCRLNWSARFDIKEGLRHTLQILEDTLVPI